LSANNPKFSCLLTKTPVGDQYCLNTKILFKTYFTVY